MPRRVRLRRTIIVTFTVLLAVPLATYYLTRGAPPRTRSMAYPRPTSTTTLARVPRLRVGIPVPKWTTLATLRGPVPGYRTPTPTGPVQVIAPTWGAAVTLPVLAEHKHWVEVSIIGRPNGQTAWVSTADVSLTRTPYFIVVDLSRRHLLLFRMSKLEVLAPAGVGAPQTPTPLGRFFLGFFTQSPNPGYGPFIIVTSALASTVTDWEEQGTSVIAVNGPLDSAALITPDGAAVSQGSVRLLDRDLVRLRRVPAGTPIDIVTTITPSRRFARTGNGAR